LIGAAGKVLGLPLGFFKPALIRLSYSGVILESDSDSNRDKKRFADACLAIRPSHHVVEQTASFELATSTLAASRSSS
jgi:hypothetical protein